MLRDLPQPAEETGADREGGMRAEEEGKAEGRREAGKPRCFFSSYFFGKLGCTSFFFFFWMYFLIQGFMRQIHLLKINPTLFLS